MAVFTAIAAAITGAITGVGFAAAFAAAGTFTALGLATSVLAAGIGIATARALGLGKVPQINTADPGTTIQLPPATFNRLPVLYGKVFTSGPIFDAAISNENKTMTYCIALSEETQTGTFSVSNIFMNDARLVFSGNTVTSHVDPNATSDTSFAGNVRVNVYAGGSGSGDIIFPTSGTGSTTPASSIVSHWGANHTANAMVFAVVQIDYDAENGLTGLPTMTFEVTNSLKNPGDVLFDYLTSDRYGAGLANTDLDVNSITGTANTSMKGYCDELVPYTDKSNVSTTNERFEINGVLSTFDSCSTNIDKICTHSATFFTFDVKQGKFKAVPNRAISAAEQANCLVYSDNNIVSKIDISSTELYNLFNAVEVEYPDKNRKDQLNTIKLEIPAGDRNANEPDNVLSYKLDLINDNIRAERLANIDLNQSRNSRVIQFEADFSGIQSDVGDVIQLQVINYGLINNFYRVMRVSEREADLGMVTAQISAIEYDADVYGNPAITETPDLGLVDLPRIPTITSIPTVKAFNGSYGNLAALPNVFGNVIVNQAMKTFGAGTQLEDAGLDTGNANIASGTDLELITPQLYDLTDSDPGDYTFTAEASLGGTITGAYDVGFRNNVTLTFANATSVVNVNYGGGGVYLIGVQDFTPQLVDNKKVSTDPVSNGLPSDMKIANATIRLQGNTTIDASAAAIRKFGNMGFAMTRITKGEK